MTDKHKPDFVGYLDIEEGGFKKRIQVAAWKNSTKTGEACLGMNIGGQICTLFENKTQEKKSW